MNPELIVFDLNKTLIKENSWRDLNLAMGVTPAEDAKLMEQARRGEITDTEGQAELLKIYQQRGDVSRPNVEKILWRYTYMPYARDVVGELRKRGYNLAIVSGAMDILVQHVAAELQIPWWRSSNRFIFDENDQLIQIQSPEKDTSDKLRQLQQLVGELSITLADWMVVGDGANDAALFQATGNGVTFTDSLIVNDARWVVNDLSGVLSIIE